MAIILSSEYRNQNRRRAYPFADDASLTDKAGVQLPTDFIIDAFLYPIDLGGSCWLSRIDVGNRTLYFADTKSGKEFGAAEWTEGEDTAYVYEILPYGRAIGTVVFGPGISSVAAGGVLRVFEQSATPLVPTAFVPLQQTGLRGILLPDGTLMVGDVKILGVNGVTVTTTVVDAVRIIRFDMRGAPMVTPEDCQAGLSEPITSICVERAKGSFVVVSQYAPGIVALSGWGVTLDDICAAKRARRLPDSDGKLPNDSSEVCDPPDPPVPPVYPDDELAVCTDAKDTSHLNIVTPSVPGAVNPLSVKNEQGAGAVPRLPPTTAVRSLTQLAPATARFTDPPAAAGTVTILMKGQGGPKI